MTRLTSERRREIAARAVKASQGPWYPGHIGDKTIECECRSILNEGYCGSIATVSVDNGKSIGDGGNDSPPYDEAVANGQFIAHARADIPDLLAEVEALEAEIVRLQSHVADGTRPVRVRKVERRPFFDNEGNEQ